jgi:hypothetical protein
MIQGFGALAAIDWDNYSSNLPIVLVDSFGQEITKEGGRGNFNINIEKLSQHLRIIPFGTLSMLLTILL